MNKNNPYQSPAADQDPRRRNYWLVAALAFFIALAVLLGSVSILMAKRARMAENMAQQARQAAEEALNQARRAQQELNPVDDSAGPTK